MIKIIKRIIWISCFELANDADVVCWNRKRKKKKKRSEGIISIMTILESSEWMPRED